MDPKLAAVASPVLATPANPSPAHDHDGPPSAVRAKAVTEKITSARAETDTLTGNTVWVKPAKSDSALSSSVETTVEYFSPLLLISDKSSMNFFFHSFALLLSQQIPRINDLNIKFTGVQAKAYDCYTGLNVILCSVYAGRACIAFPKKISKKENPLEG